MTYARPWQPPPEELGHFTQCKLRDQATAYAFELIGDPVSKRIAQRLRACTPQIQLIVERGDNTEGLSRKAVCGGRCKQRICSLCGMIRAQQVYNKLRPRMERVLREFLGARAIFMTRTIESVPIPYLKTVIPALMKACAAMARTKAYKRAFLGRMTAIEVTVNPQTRLAHPHVHEMAMARPGYFSKANDFYFSHEKHAAMWSEITGADRKLVCDIRPMKPKRLGDPLATALSEICKYPLKPQDVWTKTDEGYYVDPSILEPLHYAMKGRRLYAFGGVLRSMTQDFVELNAETVDGEWAITAEHLAELKKLPRGELVTASNYLWTGSAFEDEQFVPKEARYV